MSYDIHEHRHRFACWAAARASQRGVGGLTTKIISEALTQYLRRPGSIPDVEVEFDAWHHERVTQIQNTLNDKGNLDIAYGRVAKMVAIYLKVTVVLSGQEATPLAKVLHPPIDEFLLKGLAENNSQFKKDQQGYKWSKATKEEYSGMIAELRKLIVDKTFWMIEKDWDLVGEPEKGLEDGTVLNTAPE